jgi:cell wall-associated NlpC family hydrolase
MLSRSDVTAAARGLIGTPFRHQGRNADGIDCVGLIIATARRIGLGLNWPDMPYQRFPPEDYVRAVLDRYLDGPLTGPPQPGDVALIRWRRNANHLAIVGDGAEPYSLIHAYYVTGRVVEHRADESWRDRIVSRYRFRDVALSRDTVPLAGETSDQAELDR